jgi:hypothetical protein
LVRGRVRPARRQLGQGTGTDAGAVSCCRYRRQLRPSLTALTNTRTATPSTAQAVIRRCPSPTRDAQQPSCLNVPSGTSV